MIRPVTFCHRPGAGRLSVRRMSSARQPTLTIPAAAWRADVGPASPVEARMAAQFS